MFYSLSKQVPVNLTELLRDVVLLADLRTG